MLVLTPLPLVIVANAAVGRRWAHLAIGILAGVSAGVTFLIGALDLAGAGRAAGGPSAQISVQVDFAYMVTAAISAGLASRPIRERVARFVPIDPDNPVHALALVLAVLLFGMSVATTLFTNLASTAPPFTLADEVTQEFALVVLAAAGVGIFTRRDLKSAARRLGLVVPSWWQVVLAIAAGGAFFGFDLAMQALSYAWTPDSTRQVQTNAQHLFSAFGGPLGIAVIALAPGICEEIMFRGALQPRLGLLATAILFAAIHTQYGVSLIELSVFVLALGLGLLRKLTNTTTSAICHSTYNLLIAIVGFVGVATWLAQFAIVLELVLVAVAAYGIRSVRRRATQPASP